MYVCVYMFEPSKACLSTELVAGLSSEAQAERWLRNRGSAVETGALLSAPFASLLSLLESLMPVRPLQAPCSCFLESPLATCLVG